MTEQPADDGAAKLRRQFAAISGGFSGTEASQQAIDGGNGGSHLPGMMERLTRLEGLVDALRVTRPMTIAVLTLFLAAMIGGFTFLGVQITRVDGKLDAIPGRLADEFRAMRLEMASQTSAIANAITATKQSPPQVILVPAPSPAPQQQPKP